MLLIIVAEVSQVYNRSLAFKRKRCVSRRRAVFENCLFDIIVPHVFALISNEIILLYEEIGK